MSAKWLQRVEACLDDEAWQSCYIKAGCVNLGILTVQRKQISASVIYLCTVVVYQKY